MPLTSLDHVNIRTADLEAMARFYIEIMGLRNGERPPFSNPGIWLYCGDTAAVHLVGQDRSPKVAETRIEHFAFKAQGLADFLALLRDNTVAYSVSVVPERGIRQVNLYDPDGNHIEVQYGAEEEADISPYGELATAV
jgi:catechol 2,3-dioxygenase-like lactoylglutathione lyase family enzyme